VPGWPEDDPPSDGALPVPPPLLLLLLLLAPGMVGSPESSDVWPLLVPSPLLDPGDVPPLPALLEPQPATCTNADAAAIDTPPKAKSHRPFRPFMAHLSDSRVSESG
jgi:hypothetical protein